MFDRLKNKTILVVEDEKVIRDNLASMLSIFFKKVYTAINGEDGLDQYEQYLPDIIITDLKMPHMGGYEMLKEINKKADDVFTIIVSAHTDTDLLINAIHSEVDRYIIKPINEDALFESFKAYFEKIDKETPQTINIDESTSLDLENSKVLRDDEEIHLNKKETLLLKLITKSPDKTYSYEEIENNVWGADVMSTSAIRSVVRDLRKKLGKNYVVNVSGTGYRFNP